jgi:hypothetical protein
MHRSDADAAGEQQVARRAQQRKMIARRPDLQHIARLQAVVEGAGTAA